MEKQQRQRRLFDEQSTSSREMGEEVPVVASVGSCYSSRSAQADKAHGAVAPGCSGPLCPKKLLQSRKMARALFHCLVVVVPR